MCILRVLQCTHSHNNMDRQSVSSTNIDSIGWEDGTLEVEFSSGRIYEYHGVPEHVYIDLMDSASVGEYFTASIKFHYNYTRIS